MHEKLLAVYFFLKDGIMDEGGDESSFDFFLRKGFGKRVGHAPDNGDIESVAVIEGGFHREKITQPFRRIGVNFLESFREKIVF